MKRITIYPAEVAVILGKSQSSARTIVRAIKDAHKKKSHQPITIKEFCDFMDLPFKEVFDMVNNIKEESPSKSA